jgi:hypothetical protein
MGVYVMGAYLIPLSGKSYKYCTFLPPRGSPPNTLGTSGGLNYAVHQYTKLIPGMLPPKFWWGAPLGALKR